MAYHHILVFLIDFDYLEFHCLAHKDVVVADGLDVDLRAGQECFDAEYIDNHAALCTIFDEALDDFLGFESLVDLVPSLLCTGVLVRQQQLAFLVFLFLDIDFNLVAYFQVGVVTELVGRDDAVALIAYVNQHFALVDGYYGSLNHFVFGNLVQGVTIGFFLFFFACASTRTVVFVGIPVEVV